jgi:hypothetical protein
LTGPSARCKPAAVEEKKLVGETVGARVLQKTWDSSEIQTDAGVYTVGSQDKGASQQPLNTSIAELDKHPSQSRLTEPGLNGAPGFMLFVEQVLY